LQKYSVPLKTGPVGCPKTSVRNCQHSPHNNPEERGSLFVSVLLCKEIDVYIPHGSEKCCWFDLYKEGFHLFPHNEL
jgi:hypothetical protein